MIAPASPAARRRLPNPVRLLRIHVRLFAALAIGVALYLLLPDGLKLATRLLIAWNVGVVIYLVLAAIMIARFEIKRVRHRAADADEGAGLILALTVAASIASLGAIIGELGAVKSLSGLALGAALGLATLTIVLSWAFIQVIFALHYAHEFYGDRGDRAGGLIFPEEKRPDYWDFVYFAFVIGMTFQVSDVQVSNRKVRRTVVVHGIVAFFFNLAILALAVNIAGSLVGQ